MDGAMAAQGMAVPGMAAPGTGAAMAVATAVLMGAVVTAAAMAVAMAVVMVAWEGTAGQDTAVDMGDPLDTEATAPAMGEVIADMGLSTEAPLEGQRWGALQGLMNQGRVLLHSPRLPGSICWLAFQAL